MFVGTVCMSNAQEKVSFGVRAGLNINSLSYSGDELSGDLKSRAGFHVGAVVDWNVAKNVYIQPGIYFTTRGTKYELRSSEWDYSSSTDGKMNMNYLQIPVSVSYRFPIGNILKIDVNVGPYIALGLGGKMKVNYRDEYDGEWYDVEKFEYKIFEKSSEDRNGGDFKRFDAGLRFGAGVHIKKFFVGLNYDLGLTNLARIDEYSYWLDNEKFKNGSLQISVGYNF